MQEIDKLLIRMADIEVPSPPDWTPALLSGMLIILLLVLVIALAWWWRKTARAQQHHPVIKHELPAHHQLEILQAQWQSGSLPDREAAYRLATILRLGLGLSQLTANCPKHLCHKKKAWLSAIAFLDNIRYQKQTTAPITLELFEHAGHCLSAPSALQE